MDSYSSDNCLSHLPDDDDDMMSMNERYMYTVSEFDFTVSENCAKMGEV